MERLTLRAENEWRLAALLAGFLGAGCSAAIIAAQSDPWSINWPLALVPALAVPLVLFQSRLVQMTAAVAMALWCSLTGFSLGLFFVPCVVLMFGAARRST